MNIKIAHFNIIIRNQPRTYTSTQEIVVGLTTMRNLTYVLLLVVAFVGYAAAGTSHQSYWCMGSAICSQLVILRRL